MKSKRRNTVREVKGDGKRIQKKINVEEGKVKKRRGRRRSMTIE